MSKKETDGRDSDASHCYAAWLHEDELPSGYPYDIEFPRSKVVDGVRMFPPHVCNWRKSMDGGTEICKCGAWR